MGAKNCVPAGKLITQYFTAAFKFPSAGFKMGPRYAITGVRKGLLIPESGFFEENRLEYYTISNRTLPFNPKKPIQKSYYFNTLSTII